jgi:hypothetical protein
MEFRDKRRDVLVAHCQTLELPLTSRLDVEDRIDAPGWAELQEDGTLEGQIDRQILAHFFNSLLE